MPKTPEAWTTAAEVAQHLAISEVTLQRWVADRGVPVHRIGRTLRFRLSEVDAWVEGGGRSVTRRKARG